MFFPTAAIGRSRIALIVPLLAMVCAPALATNGYFQHGFGTRSKAMAGAGVATGLDSLAPAVNPALLLDVGDRVDVSASFFVPMREYTASPSAGGQFPLQAGRVTSQREFFVIPAAGVSFDLGPRQAAGVALYGNGGINTEYDDIPRLCPDGQGGFAPGRGTFCAGKAGVDLIQLFLSPTYSYAVTDRLSVGIAPIFALQRFEATGVASFAGFSGDPGALSNQGHEVSIGGGVRFGARYRVSDRWHVGTSFRPRVWMSKFDKYAGLFADGGDFDIPATFVAGTSFALTPRFTALLDFEYTWYSDIQAVGNPFARPGLLGQDGGPGFGWDDVWVLKLGAQWDISERWTLRGGYSYADQPVQDQEVLFNTLAPGVIEHHVTGGFTYDLTRSISVDFATFYAFKNEVSGTNPLAPDQTITLEMDQFEATAGFAWRF